MTKPIPSIPLNSKGRAVALEVSWTIFILGLACLAFWPATKFGVLNIDDKSYLFENVHIRRGLTFSGFEWAISTNFTGYWHPLTWISLMLDVQLWGFDPAVFHRTNILLHAANSILLYHIFRAAGCQRIFSCLVTAIFTLHPQRIESVTWIAERKDVLWAFFGFATLLFHVHWRKTGFTKYKLASCLSFILALLSKPQAIVIPLFVLLLDFWPLVRISPPTIRNMSRAAWTEFKDLWHLFGLSACIALYTLWDTSSLGITISWSSHGLADRLACSAQGYGTYLLYFLNPPGVCIYYPLDFGWVNHLLGLGWIVIVAILLSALHAWYRNLPWVFTGVFWFFLAILPVCGLTQNGAQLMADRYSYMASIGLAILVAGFVEITLKGNLLCRCAAILWLIFLTVRLHQEMPHMESSLTVMQRTIQLSESSRPNWFARTNLAEAFLAEGKPQEAEDTLNILAGSRFPDNIESQILSTKFYALLQQEKLNEAAAIAEDLSNRFPEDSSGWALRGILSERNGQIADAKRFYRKAYILTPSSFGPRQLANIAIAERQTDEAIKQLRIAADLAPGDLSIAPTLYSVLRKANNPPAAAAIYESYFPAIGRDADPLTIIGQHEVRTGNAEYGIPVLQECLRRDPRSYPSASTLIDACIAKTDLAAAADALGQFKGNRMSYALLASRWATSVFSNPLEPAVSVDRIKEVMNRIPASMQRSSLRLQWIKILTEWKENTSEDNYQKSKELLILAKQAGNMVLAVEIRDVLKE